MAEKGGPVHHDGPSTLPLARELLDPSSSRTVLYRTSGGVIAYRASRAPVPLWKKKKLSGVEREATKEVLIDGSFRLPP